MSNYDKTCDSTEEWMFLNYHKDTLKKPDPTWHFNRVEIIAIAMIYFKLQRDADCDLKQEMPSKQFSHMMHKAFGLADNSLIERIFSASDITSSVPLKKWIAAMSLFLRGKHEIRREQMVNLLKKFVYKHQDEDVDEAVKDLVDIIIKKMDHDKDGIVGFEDFCTTVLEDPMMLECFGQCLPDRKHVHTFLMTFTDKIKSF